MGVILRNVWVAAGATMNLTYTIIDYQSGNQILRLRWRTNGPHSELQNAVCHPEERWIWSDR